MSFVSYGTPLSLMDATNSNVPTTAYNGMPKETNFDSLISDLKQFYDGRMVQQEHSETASSNSQLLSTLNPLFFPSESNHENEHASQNHSTGRKDSSTPNYLSQIMQSGRENVIEDIQFKPGILYQNGIFYTHQDVKAGNFEKILSSPNHEMETKSKAHGQTKGLDQCLKNTSQISESDSGFRSKDDIISKSSDKCEDEKSSDVVDPNIRQLQEKIETLKSYYDDTSLRNNLSSLNSIPHYANLSITILEEKLEQLKKKNAADRRYLAAASASKSRQCTTESDPYRVQKGKDSGPRGCRSRSPSLESSRRNLDRYLRSRSREWQHEKYRSSRRDDTKRGRQENVSTLDSKGWNYDSKNRNKFKRSRSKSLTRHYSRSRSKTRRNRSRSRSITRRHPRSNRRSRSYHRRTRSRSYHKRSRSRRRSYSKEKRNRNRRRSESRLDSISRIPGANFRNYEEKIKQRSQESPRYQAKRNDELGGAKARQKFQSRNHSASETSLSDSDKDKSGGKKHSGPCWNGCMCEKSPKCQYYVGFGKNSPRRIPKNMWGREPIKYPLRQGSETKSGNYNNVPFDYSQKDKSAKKARTGWFKPHGEIIGQTKNTPDNAEVSNKTASAVGGTNSSKTSTTSSQKGICRPWAETGKCPYGNECRFKHVSSLVSPSKRSGTSIEVSNKTASAVASDISSGNFDTPTVSLSSISSNVSNTNGTNMTLSGLSNLSSPPSKALENVESKETGVKLAEKDSGDSDIEEVPVPPKPTPPLVELE